jgi:hypothetical protein
MHLTALTRSTSASEIVESGWPVADASELCELLFWEFGVIFSKVKDGNVLTLQHQHLATDLV